MHLPDSQTSRPALDRSRAGISAVGAVLGGFLFLLLILGLVSMNTYNGLVDRREGVDAAMTEITNQYKRRLDLVPQLVSTVKGAADFEKDTITAVTDARSRVGSIELPDDILSDPAMLEKFMAAQSELGGALTRLLAVAENYPNLTATAGFRDLQSQLEGTENRIAVARTDAITSLKAHNAGVKRFPAVLFAGAFGFESLPQLEFTDSAEDLETAPNVDFSDE